MLLLYCIIFIIVYFDIPEILCGRIYTHKVIRFCDVVSTAGKLMAIDMMTNRLCCGSRIVVSVQVYKQYINYCTTADHCLLATYLTIIKISSTVINFILYYDI